MDKQKSEETMTLPYSDRPGNIEAYFASGQYDKDHARFQKNSGKKTGFANLDEKQPLFPGLYVLGAIPGLGKTTFAHQMADSLAASGDCVLYFTLEQSKIEMVSKSLSRKTFVNYHMNGKKGKYFTSLQIRSGVADGSRELDEAIAGYRSEVEDRLSIISANFGISARDIEKFVKGYIKKYQVRPVVIVDYLQIVAPDPEARKMDARGNIDDIIHTLKVMQTKYSLTVIAISSFNRNNYTKHVDFESFKESGGVEYTADVIWGMQLQLMSAEKEAASVNQMRRQMDEAKRKLPRKVELCCLKNRFGNLYTCGYNYYCNVDYFGVDTVYEKKHIQRYAEEEPVFMPETDLADDFSDLEEVQEAFI